ncbi:MAG: peptidylprolyl isomerase [Microgenomates group bacterium]
MTKTIVFILIVVLLVGGFFTFKFFLKNTSPEIEQRKEIKKLTESEEAPKVTIAQGELPVVQIDKNKTYIAILKTTEGDITIGLNAKETPITVNNFVFLAKKGFYNNTIFHRVIKGFMIQGGDPNGDGTGGPGYTFNDEPFEGEYTRGTVAMANSGPNTNGSQFFIMHEDYALPKNYVIFGKVIEGMDVVDKIAEAPVEQSPSGEMSKPVHPVQVESVQIIEK